MLQRVPGGGLKEDDISCPRPACLAKGRGSTGGNLPRIF